MANYNFSKCDWICFQLRKIVEGIEKINSKLEEHIVNSTTERAAQQQCKIKELKKLKRRFLWRMRTPTILTIFCLVLSIVAFACNFIFENKIYAGILKTEQVTNKNDAESNDCVNAEEITINASQKGSNDLKIKHTYNHSTYINIGRINLIKECIAMYSVAAVLLFVILVLVFAVRKKCKILSAVKARFQVLCFKVQQDAEYPVENVNRELGAIASMVEDMQSKHSSPWRFFE